jgi:hypothetical protein
LRIVLDAVSRKAEFVHQLLGGDAEMRQDRSHHQRGDGDLDQRP